MECDWPELKTATLRTGGTYLPPLRAIAPQATDHTTRRVPGQGRVIFYLDPQLGPEVLIGYLKLLFGILAHLAATRPGQAA